MAGPVRIGQHGLAVYLDLRNKGDQVVKITADGWKVLGKAPMRFGRPSSLAALPIPVPGGSLDLLRPVLPELDDETWMLMAAWLVGAMNPVGPYPILMVFAEPGAAKSTTCRLLKRVIDPCTGDDVRAMPEGIDALGIAATHARVLAIDNVSHIGPRQSDFLCQIATGSSSGKRQLYKDDGEVVMRVQSPVIINSVGEPVERADLLDRCIRVELQPMTKLRRRSEREVNQHFEQVHPQVLGALCSAVSMALRQRDSVALAETPRMADFAAWVVAAEPALPWEPGRFLAALIDNGQRLQRSALMFDPLCGAIHDLVPPGAQPWTGRTLDLQARLHAAIPAPTRKAVRFPANTLALVGELRRIAPHMRTTMGIDIAVSDAGQNVSIRRVDDAA